MTTDWEDFKREHPLEEEGQAEYDRLSLAFGIGEQVKDLRHKFGWSQQDLAQQMGTTQPVIARLENGGSPPSLTTLQRLAVAFDAQLNVRFTPRRGGQGDPVLRNVS